VLRAAVEDAADNVRVCRAEEGAPVLRRYAETRYGAKSWSCQRRVVARIEASTQGLDIRFVVTSFAQGSAEWIYDSLYCARGQAENLVKLHKAQLASDRTSCRSPLANQVRLVLHTAAYWLLLTLRDRIPKTHEVAAAEFATLRLRLLSTHPPRAAYRICAGPAFDLTGALSSAGKDRRRGAQWRSSPG
jgi:Transposase DDE domain group 1